MLDRSQGQQCTTHSNITQHSRQLGWSLGSKHVHSASSFPAQRGSLFRLAATGVRKSCLESPSSVRRLWPSRGKCGGASPVVRRHQHSVGLACRGSVPFHLQEGFGLLDLFILGGIHKLNGMSPYCRSPRVQVGVRLRNNHRQLLLEER